MTTYRRFCPDGTFRRPGRGRWYDAPILAVLRARGWPKTAFRVAGCLMSIPRCLFRRCEACGRTHLLVMVRMAYRTEDGNPGAGTIFYCGFTCLACAPQFVGAGRQ